MLGKEIIELDAEVKAVINTRAFRARLGNGHEFTAFVPPFDMSRGEIMEVLETEAER